MKKMILIRCALILMIVGLMTVIFLFSTQTSSASNVLSRGVLGRILDLFEFHFAPDMMETLNLILRKIAHFSLYFLLGIGTMGVCQTTAWKSHQKFLIALLICMLFASSDEIHQYLSGTRNGNVVDVLLDSCGSFFGCLAVMGVAKKIKRFKINCRENSEK